MVLEGKEPGGAEPEFSGLNGPWAGLGLGLRQASARGRSGASPQLLHPSPQPGLTLHPAVAWEPRR